MSETKVYAEYEKIPRFGTDLAILTLDVVLDDGETPDQAAKQMSKTMDVTWEISESGNCHPQIDFIGTEADLWKIRHSYRLHNNGPNKGKSPVGKGEKRT